MTNTCDNLGVCQDRTPPCPGCLPRPAFAPGVIEHHRAPHPMRDALLRWLVVTAAVMALAWVAGYAVGVLS